MPTFLLDAYIEMYSKLRAEEGLEMLSIIQSSNNMGMKDNDRRQYMRELQLRANRGKIHSGGVTRPSSLAELQEAGLGTVIAENEIGGQIVLPPSVRSIDMNEVM